MKDRTYEDWDDKKLAVLLQEYAEEEGRQLIEENERLRNDPDFVVPESFNRACHDAIEKAAKREKRRIAWSKARKSLKHVAIIALVLCLTGGTLFCTVDAFRFRVLNALISHKDTNTRVDITIENETTETKGMIENLWVPEEYEHVFSDNTSTEFQLHYFQTSDGRVIELYLVQSFSGTINVDSEDATVVSEVEVNGNKAVLEIKEKKHLSWYNSEKEMLCDLFCDLTVSEEDMIRIAQSVK